VELPVGRALDVVAHELTHGVTEFTSNLIYRNESGALNEAFSDIVATSAEFFFQPPGDGPLRADYRLAEDVVTPGDCARWRTRPSSTTPITTRAASSATGDNGGVHTNSGIANQAFYLAIEGARTARRDSACRGSAARTASRSKRVFYRAFTQLLPSNATFSVARAATIQAARDLHGANSAAERAVTQAWTAVGVKLNGVHQEIHRGEILTASLVTLALSASAGPSRRSRAPGPERIWFSVSGGVQPNREQRFPTRSTCRSTRRPRGLDRLIR
jgi:thermolysin